MRFYLRKLLFYVVAFWAALTLNFVIPRLMPGNPVDTMLAKLSERGPVTPAARHAVELLLGTNTSEPLVNQYLEYLGRVATGDLGLSVTFYPATVSTIIRQTLP